MTASVPWCPEAPRNPSDPDREVGATIVSTGSKREAATMTAGPARPIGSQRAMIIWPLPDRLTSAAANLSDV